MCYGPSMIFTFTDFGIEGPYLGQMRAAILSVAPEVTVVDLMSNVPAFDIRAAAHLLPAVIAPLPVPSICVAVIDPGVGSERKPLALLADGRWYVGPDNGLLSVAAARAVAATWYEISWRPERLSASFHGRDLFAPVAARIALGEAPETWGAPLDPAETVSLNGPEDLEEVIYIDHYGNCMTGIRASGVEGSTELRVSGRSFPRVRTFSDVPPGTCFCYENAIGLMEIATNGGNAAVRLGLRLGSQVSVRNV